VAGAGDEGNVVSTCPDDFGQGYMLQLGSYGGTDDRFKRRKRKQPVGFAPPRLKPKPRKRQR
jgi:hypothetical protein